MSRRRLRPSTSLRVFALTLFATGCVEDAAGTTPCTEGTIRSGDTCLSLGADAGANGGAGGGSGRGGDGGQASGGGGQALGGDTPPPTGGEAQGGNGGGGAGQGGGGAGGQGGPGDALPLVVDDVYVPSGFMGDGATPGGVVVGECALPDAARGLCRSFTWTPGEAGWAGVWWQYPEGNWGGADGLPGFPMPPGAAQVSFLAWGAAGGEVVSFNAGLSEEVDGFTRGVAGVTLSAEPTRYRIDLRGATYGDVVGGFSWVAGDAPGPVAFNVADIQWTDDPTGLPELPAGGALPLPVAVDDHWSPSGFMGDGAQPGGIVVDECAARGDAAAVGLCRRFTWTPGAAGWAGVFWQYPENNWGSLPGLAIAPGATEVSFLAWGAAGDERVTFGAGMADADGFAAMAPTQVLTTTPTRYTVSLAEVIYDEVVGAFTWTANEAAAPVVFHVDDLTWR